MNFKAIKISKNNIYLKEKAKINIKLFADIHFCSSFDSKKLELINKVLNDKKTDYICIPGDIIDSTTFLKNNNKKKEELLNWFKYLGKNYKTFISLGNHDYSKRECKNWYNDDNNDFWQEVAKISGINLITNYTSYEDDKIIIRALDPTCKYYSDNFKKEDSNILKEKLLLQQKYLKKLNPNKVKVLLIHSPIHMTNKEILPLIKDYDLILSGHMHNGVVPPILDGIIKGNKGLIAPNKTLFPDNSRGIKEIDIDNKKVYLIITGGITKIQECASKLLRPFNHLYPMSINDIMINYTYSNKNTYKYKFF